MLNIVVRFAILSIIIIVVMHSLYSFLVKNLTIPRVKDLVHKPQTQYENIIRSLTENENRKERDLTFMNNEKNDNRNRNQAEAAAPSNLSANQIEMKNELKSYINDLKTSRNNKKEEMRKGMNTSSSSIYDNYDTFSESQPSLPSMEPMSASNGGNFDNMMLSPY